MMKTQKQVLLWVIGLANLSDASIANGMMNELPCVIIVDCHENKHFSALMETGTPNRLIS